MFWMPFVQSLSQYDHRRDVQAVLRIVFLTAAFLDYYTYSLELQSWNLLVIHTDFASG